MKMQMTDQIAINVPAEKAWRVLAHEFEHIGRWAVIIDASAAASDIPAFEACEIGGRTCTAQGFGDVKEQFIHYDEASMRYAYEAIAGLPSFLTRAVNNWSVHAAGLDHCVVESSAEIEVKRFPGIILAPIFKWRMGWKGREMLEELKYYLERDQPHPRKLKAQQ